jgi:hypothetical protein
MLLLTYHSFYYRIIFISSVLDTVMQILTSSSGHEQAYHTVRNATLKTHQMASVCQSAIIRRSSHQVFVHSWKKEVICINILRYITRKLVMIDFL